MDLVELIMADHHEQRRMFALLDEVGNDSALLEPVDQPASRSPSPA